MRNTPQQTCCGGKLSVTGCEYQGTGEGMGQTATRRGGVGGAVASIGCLALQQGCRRFGKNEFCRGAVSSVPELHVPARLITQESISHALGTCWL